MVIGINGLLPNRDTLVEPLGSCCWALCLDSWEQLKWCLLELPWAIEFHQQTGLEGWRALCLFSQYQWPWGCEKNLVVYISVGGLLKPTGSLLELSEQLKDSSLLELLEQLNSSVGKLANWNLKLLSLGELATVNLIDCSRLQQRIGSTLKQINA